MDEITATLLVQNPGFSSGRRGLLVLALVLTMGISLFAGPYGTDDGTHAGAEETAPTENRTVLMELFTETWCQPCKNVDLATDRLREHYTTDELAILELHYDQSGDPFFTHETNSRFNRFYSLNNWPTAMFDGQIKDKGGGKDEDEVYDRYAEQVDFRLQEKSHFFIKMVEERYSEDTGYVRSYIAERTDPGKRNLTIFTAIFRDKLHFDGGNGILEHRYVVRNLFSEPFDGPTQIVEYDFTLPDDSRYIKSGDRVGIVVFVQDNDTHEVLQASMKLLYTEEGPSSNGGDAKDSVWYSEPVFLVTLSAGIVILGAAGFVVMKNARAAKIRMHSRSHTRQRLTSGQGLASEKRKDEFTSCPECGVRVKKTNLNSHLRRVHSGRKK